MCGKLSVGDQSVRLPSLQAGLAPGLGVGAGRKAVGAVNGVQAHEGAPLHELVAQEVGLRVLPAAPVHLRGLPAGRCGTPKGPPET